jgi:hypothetical protein
MRQRDSISYVFYFGCFSLADGALQVLLDSQTDDHIEVVRFSSFTPSKLADDAMAILSAFSWPEVRVVGITTLFGNVPTDLATANALILRDIATKNNPSGARVPNCLTVKQK